MPIIRGKVAVGELAQPVTKAGAPSEYRFDGKQVVDASGNPVKTVPIRDFLKEKTGR